jgi:predicted DCC family thiol-disulfide oxidoreductase YuxK
MLYDGECPLCMREVEMLMNRDKGNNKIDFVDIASSEYDPSDNAGITFEEAMKEIHAITADGQVLTGIAVFRRLYECVGLGFIYAVTRWKPVEIALNRVYDVWAKYRLPLTGRPDLATVLAEKKLKSCRLDDQDCE